MRPLRANIAFWLLWSCALTWSFFNGYDDPSSLFYDEDRAFDRHFSARREAEVDDFLRREIYATEHAPPGDRTGTGEFLCVGIPSINRTNSEFLPHAVGSLVDTLSEEERRQIRIVVLLADKDPTAHFAYGQDWLPGLADNVIMYDSANVTAPSELYTVIPRDVRGAGRSDSRVENIRLDHSVLVEQCRLHDPAYFALVEDDIIASRDWFSRFRAGVAEVERRSEASGRDWLYLRLFYSEIFMGWNNEEVFDYLKVIIVAYTVAIICLFAALRYRSRRPSGRPATRDFAQYVALVLGLWMPACIALTFVTGRITIHRLMPSPGVREMPRYGCCAQGVVFPNRHLPGMQDLLRNPPYKFPGDMITEGYAKNKRLAKWALDPSVMQHVGLVESSEGPRRAEVWNFSFERLSPG